MALGGLEGAGRAQGAPEQQLYPAVPQEILPADIKVGVQIEGFRRVGIIGLGCNQADAILEEYW